jgi:hypothetical protein
MIDQINYFQRNFVLNLYTPLKSIGKMKSVSDVAVTNPPITTTARGLDDSEPIPVEMAAGRRPIAARDAVITTGRILAITPDRMASSRCIRE